VLAGAALDELMAEMAAAQPSEPTKTNAATPDQGIRGVLKDFDGVEHT
jgi:hypothetical protein